MKLSLKLNVNHSGFNSIIKYNCIPFNDTHQLKIQNSTHPRENGMNAWKMYAQMYMILFSVSVWISKWIFFPSELPTFVDCHYRCIWINKYSRFDACPQVHSNRMNNTSTVCVYLIKCIRLLTFSDFYLHNIGGFFSLPLSMQIDFRLWQIRHFDEYSSKLQNHHHQINVRKMCSQFNATTQYTAFHLICRHFTEFLCVFIKHFPAKSYCCGSGWLHYKRTYSCAPKMFLSYCYYGHFISFIMQITNNKLSH